MFITEFTDLRSQHISLREKIAELESLANVLDNMLHLNDFVDAFSDYLGRLIPEKDVLYFYDAILTPQFQEASHGTIQPAIKITPQDLIEIVDKQEDKFAYEHENESDDSYNFDEENYDTDAGDDSYNFDENNYYSSEVSVEIVSAIKIKSIIIAQLQKLKPEYIEVLKKRKETLDLQLDDLFNKLLQNATPGSELLFTIPDELDQDLQTVIDYRENKNKKSNKGLLWMQLDAFIGFRDSVYDTPFEAKLIEIMGNISKLGFLHHSGNALVGKGMDFSRKIIYISDLLPNVSSVVLRGCGMATEDKSKSLAKAEIKKSNQSPCGIFDFAWTKGDKQEPTREHTLDVPTYDAGMGAASDLTTRIIDEIRKSKIGVNAEHLSVKFYVGPYHGDIEKGAKGDPGDSGRYLSAPKALRFFIKNKETKPLSTEELDTSNEPNPPKR